MGSITAQIPLRVVEAATRRGLEAGHLLRVFGVSTPEALRDERLPIERHFELWERIMAALRDPGFPVFVGSMRSAADLEVRGFAAATSATGWEAFERGIRYTRLTSDTVRFELDSPTPGRARLCLHRPGQRTLGHRCDNEGALAGWVAMVRAILDPDFVCTRVTFQHGAPREVFSHAEFFGTEPTFDHSTDCIEFDATVLDRSPGSSNPAMRDFFDRHAQALLAKHSPPQGELRTALERKIAARLSSGLPAMESVAAELGMSERGLRRHLSSEGIGYQELVAEVRLGLARTLLDDPQRSLSDISFLLGFSEQSAFSRFFRKHSGCSPRAFRKRTSDT
ncbi:MAG: AraC family transcriptional regulator [Nannocystaceae bacterium]|nr:AraC family transcriptional regulator [Nannocystaceae bacterium]